MCISEHAAATEIYTLSLHDALPIWLAGLLIADVLVLSGGCPYCRHGWEGDRKSTRLNSSHLSISYALFCLKKSEHGVGPGGGAGAGPPREVTDSAHHAH